MTRDERPSPQPSPPNRNPSARAASFPEQDATVPDPPMENDVLHELRRQARTVGDSLRRSFDNQVTGHLLRGVAGLVRKRSKCHGQESEPDTALPHATVTRSDDTHANADPDPGPAAKEALPIESLLKTFAQRREAREKRRRERERASEERRQRLAAVQAPETLRDRAAPAKAANDPPGTTPTEIPADPGPPPVLNVSEGPSRDRYPTRTTDESYRCPPLELLDCRDDKPRRNEQEIEQNRRIIQDTIDSFSIDAEVGRATRGPRVTLYEVTVARGVKVESITGIANNLAMELAAIRLRILAPVPGRDHVGIEVPNRHPGMVRLGAMLSSRDWRHSRANLPLPVGRDIHGRDVILDLAKAPHLLVAGATGSGKSVCLNSMIVAMLTRFTPDDLRLILVDPKIVEFRAFMDVPHLLVPVINDADTVPLALRWLLREMERRYAWLADAQVRDIDAYNRRPAARKSPGPKDERNPPAHLPRIVLIIDELADLMLTARNDVETALARLAQMARAVGIHAILSTQRPSVNVLTGIIKANFPTRLAFQVASQIDARTILDTKGAETLLGSGDLLYKPPGLGTFQRLQSPLVQDHELEAVAEHAARQRVVEPDFELLKCAQEDGQHDESGSTADIDEALLSTATDVVLRDRRASTSYLQRCLRIGYNRAAALMDALEERGVVGPRIASHPREILLGWDDLNSDRGTVDPWKSD